MHIAVVTGQFPVVSKTFILNQVTGFIDAGHEVTILARPPENPGMVHPAYEEYGLDDYIVYWSSRTERQQTVGPIVEATLEAGVGDVAHSLVRSIAAADRFDESWNLRMAERVVRTSPTPAFDVILCHFGTVGRTCQILRESGAIDGPLVTVFHGYDMSLVLREEGDDFYRELLASGELFLPISDFWRRRLVEMGAPSAKTRVHHMGVDPQRFSFRVRRPDDDGETKILSVARLVEKKGLEYGIRAFRQIAEDFEDVRYTIIGDGELREELEALARSEGVGDRIDFAGWCDREEVLEALGSHQILMTPSVTAEDGDMEGIPVVLMEGMATGIPVVSTRHSGIPELVRHGETGLLADERDVEGLAGHLRTLLDDPSTWEAMGRRGRQVVEEEFAVDVLNEELLALLQERFGHQK